MFNFFRKLRSNQPINPSVHVQDQQEILKQIQKLNAKNQKRVNNMQDFESFNQRILKQNEDWLNRKP